eukprot:Pgem_evm1s14968
MFSSLTLLTTVATLLLNHQGLGTQAAGLDDGCGGTLTVKSEDGSEQIIDLTKNPTGNITTNGALLWTDFKAKNNPHCQYEMKVMYRWQSNYHVEKCKKMPEFKLIPIHRKYDIRNFICEFKNTLEFTGSQLKSFNRFAVVATKFSYDYS